MSQRTRRPLPGVTNVYTSVAARIPLATVGGMAAALAGSGLMTLVDGTAMEAPGLVVSVLLVAAGVWRGATARVVVDRDGLVVHNPFLTHRIRWADVVRVTECEPYTLTMRISHTCPCLVVRGRQYRVKCLAMTDFGDHRFAAVVKAWRR